MDTIIAALVSFLFIEPLKAEMADRLSVSRAPQAVVAEVATCTRTATPLVLERATSDPWWAATKAVSVWAGSTRPEALLVEVAPGCAKAVEAARPFLTEGEA